jgi:DNA phosphorothioation system restriction enzyme
MSLKDCNFPLSVKTTVANPIDVFFVPALSTSIQYDVAVGFFTSPWVRDAAAGIARFALNGGQARWIISPILSKEDMDAITIGVDQFSKERVEELISKSFDELFQALNNDVRRTVSWLIHDSILEIRVGIPKNELSGMLHAKMGVFADEEGERVGFSGSYNLTSAAATNWEKIDVFKAWVSEDARLRVDEIALDFKAMWDGVDYNLQTEKPSKAALLPFVREVERSARPYSLGPKASDELPRVPATFLDEQGKLRPYQEEAISNWFRANGRGIFEMATGSGKTVTALTAATKLTNYAITNESKLFTLITVPYQHLADQWYAEACAFGFSPLVCYGGKGRWLQSLQRSITEFMFGGRRVFMAIAVNATFASRAFQDAVSIVAPYTLFIADEMHNMGAETYLTSLRDDFKFRLGLSATPVRHGDEEGTKALQDYFGEPVIEFGLKDAIEHGFLCEYYYHPILCELNGQELEEYRELSKEIARLSTGRNAEDDMPHSLHLKLIKRARLLGRVESKLVSLEQLLSKRSESNFNLVYCSDSKVSGIRQVDEVVNLIGKRLNMRVHKFTADENAEERRNLIDRFSDKRLQVLAAIRCLDEGVDIPRTETAYILASSTNPRQYIQRRGRVLRRSHGKKYARIYDFISVPSLADMSSLPSDVLSVEQGIVRKEMERINEFAGLSKNPGEALEAMRDLKKKLNLINL